MIPQPLSAAPPLEYCGARKADQQLGAVPHPERNRSGYPESNCAPFIEEKPADDDASVRDGEPVRQPRELKIEHLQRDVAYFLREYREFVDCCKMDPSELERVEELGDQVGDLLRLAQSELFSEQIKLRGMTLKELIVPVARARGELAMLRKQLEQLGALMEQQDASNGEARRETPVIQDIEEAMEQAPRPRGLPSGAKTGIEIGVSPSVGRDIGKAPSTGPVIGAEGLTGPRIGVNPRTGREIGATGPTGFEIGVTGRAGPDIGESTFNNDGSSSVGSSLSPSTIGSSLQDSTVGSNLGTSSAGSSLSDSTIGSSLSSSSVGSSLQNRSTGAR
jgi:hypothetical protein